MVQFSVNHILSRKFALFVFPMGPEPQSPEQIAPFVLWVDSIIPCIMYSGVHRQTAQLKRSLTERTKAAAGTATTAKAGAATAREEQKRQQLILLPVLRLSSPGFQTVTFLSP